MYKIRVLLTGPNPLNFTSVPLPLFSLFSVSFSVAFEANYGQIKGQFCSLWSLPRNFPNLPISFPSSNRFILEAMGVRD
jgi:hypothetical protein